MYISANMELNEVYVGQLAVGFTITWSSPNIPKLQDLEKAPLPYVLSETQASLVATLIYIGALPGPFLMGWLSNVKGRKPCLLLGGIFGVIGYILLGTSRNLAMLYCGRMMTGMGSGNLIVIVYVGEIASTNIRGILLTVLGIFTTSGGIILFSLGSFISYHETVYVGLALLIIFTLCSFMIPETPIYHVLKGNDYALKQILQDLDKLIESKNKYRSITNTQDWRDLFTLRMYVGQLAVGFTITWSGPNIPKLQDLEKSPLPYVLSETQASLVASLIYIGALPGPFLMGWLSNVKGRKPCLLLGGIFGVIGFTLLGTSRNLAMLYCGRMMTGMGSGSLVMMNLVYVGEIASTNIRGILLTVLGIFTTSGGIILFSLGSFLSYHETIYVGLALYIIFTLCSIMIPETPVYHVLKGNDDALKQILQDLGRLEDLNKLIESKNKYRSINNMQDWRDLFTLRSNKRALFIVLSVNIFEHCSGVMSVRFFSSTIFETAGSSINGNIAMIIIASFQLLGSGITPVFIERIGRKILLSISCMMCSLSMFIMGLYFYLVHIGNPVIDNIKWLPLAVLIFFFISYDSGLGIVPSVLVGEMFTPNTRTNGSAVAISSSWVSGFVVNTAFGALVSKVGAYVPFWFFAANCVLAFFFTIFLIPETKGKSLLEIQEDLGKKE